MLELTREEASGFNVRNSININDLEKNKGNIADFVIPTINALKHLPKIILSNNHEMNYWETGRKIELLGGTNDIKTNDPIKVIDWNNNLLGIGFLRENNKNYLQPKLVINAK